MKLFYAIVHSRDRRIALYIIVNSIVALTMLTIANATKVHGAIMLSLGVIVMLATSLLLFGFFYAHQPPEEDGAEDSPQTFEDSTPGIPPQPSQPPTIGGMTAKQAKLNKKNKHRTTLSKFARRRIDKHLLGYANAPLIFEQRKEPIELFVQIEKRTRSEEPVNKKWRRKHKKSPPSTIYRHAFLFLLALFVFALITIGQFSSPLEAFQRGGWIFMLMSLLFVAFALLRLYNHWARWFFWRLVAFDSDKDRTLDPLLVIIDKPLLLPGGGVPPLELRRITLVSASTGRTLEDEKKARSILAGLLNYEWLQIDSDAQMDERFNWIGPFRNAPQLIRLLNRARHNARIDES